MNITTSTIGLQKTRYDKGKAASLGIPEDTFRTERVNLDAEANDAIRAIISKSLSKAVDAIASQAQGISEEGRAFAKRAMQANIDKFELCAGSGFTGTLETDLRKAEALKAVWPVAGESAPKADAPKATLKL